MIIAVAAGRRIYSNLKKTIRYIVSIHIPIILAVSLPLFFRLDLPWYFHTRSRHFFRVGYGPMCSIVYENEPAEKTACKNHQDQ
jgi:Ca2+-transporting ATPase